MKGDRIIYSLFNGKMVKTGHTANPERPNFVITCDYGDWSGFRTLAECEQQFHELEGMASRMKRGNFYYQVVER